MTFYDSTGRAIAYTEDGEYIYLFSGEPVAYLFGELVYSYSGKQLGRFKNGWIRDNSGFCVFFSENAIGGPRKPLKQLRPIKSIKHLKPFKQLRHRPVIKPRDCNGWSSKKGEQFFYYA